VVGGEDRATIRPRTGSAARGGGMSIEIEILELEHEWRTHPRWARVSRPYRAANVVRLRGSVKVESGLARRSAESLWDGLHSGRPVHACLGRAGERNQAPGRDGIDRNPSIVADGESASGGAFDAFEVMKRMIGAGVACVRLGDRLASTKDRGQRVLAPTEEVVQKLVAARFATDVLGAPTIIVARTDALGARLLASDADPRDRPFLTGERTPEGFFPLRAGMDLAVARALACAPHADVLSCETSAPDLDEARRFAHAVHARLPGKLLAYDCSPSLDRRGQLDPAALASFVRELASAGYRFLLVPPAGLDGRVGRGAPGERVRASSSA
jgi:isocitrate lyase